MTNDLHGANLRNADLRNADLIVYQAGQWIAYIQRDVIQIGCQVHSVTEWANFSDEEISEMHSNAIEYWKKHKKIILAIAQGEENEQY